MSKNRLPRSVYILYVHATKGTMYQPEKILLVYKKSFQSPKFSSWNGNDSSISNKQRHSEFHFLGWCSVPLRKTLLMPNCFLYFSLIFFYQLFHPIRQNKFEWKVSSKIEIIIFHLFNFREAAPLDKNQFPALLLSFRFKLPIFVLKMEITSPPLDSANVCQPPSYSLCFFTDPRSSITYPLPLVSQQAILKSHRHNRYANITAFTFWKRFELYENQNEWFLKSVIFTLNLVAIFIFFHPVTVISNVYVLLK